MIINNKHSIFMKRSLNNRLVLYEDSSDQYYNVENVDIPLKKMQAVLKVITGLELYNVEKQMLKVHPRKGFAVPMVFHNSKMAHHSKLIDNNRGLRGGPACYPVKCAEEVLKIIKYFKGMNKPALQSNAVSTILYFKSATATKGVTIKRRNLRWRGMSDVKVIQKVRMNIIVGIMRTKNDQ
jgi:ribosomal protein L22